jgi:hypothetical protein
LSAAPPECLRRLAHQPRPTNGVVVAMTVMNWKLRLVAAILAEVGTPSM